MVDSSRQKREHAPIHIDRATVEKIKSFNPSVCTSLRT
jgi:hypothetical protein